VHSCTDHAEQRRLVLTIPWFLQTSRASALEFRGSTWPLSRYVPPLRNALRAPVQFCGDPTNCRPMNPATVVISPRNKRKSTTPRRVRLVRKRLAGAGEGNHQPAYACLPNCDTLAIIKQQLIPSICLDSRTLLAAKELTDCTNCSMLARV